MPEEKEDKKEEKEEGRKEEKEEKSTPKKEKREPPKEAKKDDSSIQYRVRVAGVILDGSKNVERALTNIKGVGPRTSKVVNEMLDFKGRKLGELSEKGIEKIEAVLSNLDKNLPPWMLNRRNDYASGENKHLTGPDLDMAKREDLTRLKKQKSYRGLRHQAGLPVRGQRTRSTFRKGSTVGVVRKKIIAQQQKDKK